MNFLRFLLRLLLVAAAVALLALLALLTPSLQTWLAQRELAQRHGAGASIDSFWMGFGRLEVENARLEGEGFVLIVPSLEAGLSATRAWWSRRLGVKSLVAKGWTLDLSGRPAAAGTPRPPPPLAQTVVQGLRALLSEWQLPLDASFDTVELEGDVVVRAGTGSEPVPMHVKVHGGGFSAGQEGTLVVEAEAAFLDANAMPLFYTLRGRIRGAMTTARSIAGTELNAEVSVQGGSVAAAALEFSVRVARDASAPGGDRYSVGVLRGGKPLLSLAVADRRETDRLEGTWTVQLSEAEVSALGPVLPVSGALAGEGALDSDAALTRLHASGRLRGTGENLGAFSLRLQPWGVRAWELAFEAQDQGATLTLSRLEGALTAEKPVLTVRSLQPVTFTKGSKDFAVADPKEAWLEGSLDGLGLDGLPAVPGGFALTGAQVRGAFRIGRDAQGWWLASGQPLAATGVTLRRGSEILGRGLELDATVSGSWGEHERTLRLAPLHLSRSGRDWITADVTLAQPRKAGQTTTVAARLTVEVEAFAQETSAPLLKALEVTRVAGDVTVTEGELTRIAGNVSATGIDPARRLASQFTLDTDRRGAVAFHLPLTLSWGARVSDVSADGTWTPPATGNPVLLRLTAKHADWQQLRWLAGPLAALAGDEVAPEPSASAGKDAQPFWGTRPGQVMLALEELQLGDDLVKEVRGSLTLDRGGAHLKYGGYLSPDGTLTPVEGELGFDPTAGEPYGLKLAFDPVTVDATPLFGKPAEGQDAVFYGKFSVASTVVGRGRSLADLLDHTEQEYRLSSRNGIVRLLKTHVTVTGPEASKPLADTAGRVGSALGSFFGAKGLHDSGARKVNPTTQAVFDLSYGVAEIGYKDLSLTARRGADGAVRVTDLVMNAERARLTGSGRLTPVDGKPLRTWPLSVELSYAARAEMADILTKTGLPVSGKDKDGWVSLEKTFHFGGTLEAVDTSEWRDLLVKAAEKPPELKK